jgi:hypothetical protein
MTNILITGGNGYVATALHAQLSKIYNVTSVTRNDFDLTNNKQTSKWFEDKHFDVVIHTAISGGNRLHKDSIEVLDNNLKMYYNLLDNSDRFVKLINIGSGAELHATTTPYGLSKHVIRRSVLEKDSYYNLPKDPKKETRFKIEGFEYPEMKVVVYLQKGLKAKGKLYIEDSEKAKTIYKALTDKSLNEMSVGFNATDYKLRDEKNGYEFLKTQVTEASVVFNPANPEAVISDVKEITEITEIDTQKFVKSKEFEEQVVKILISKGLLNELPTTNEEPMTIDSEKELANMEKIKKILKEL